MKSKTVIISLVAALLVAGAGAFYLLTRDEGSTNTATNNGTNTAVNSPSEDEVDVRKAVMEQMPQSQQDSVDGTWHDGEVDKITLQEGALMSDGEGIFEVEEYAGKEAYIIEFPSKNMDKYHNMIIYADATTHDIIGYGLID